MFNTVAGKKIALFGFAFKADTGDTRESPAAEVTKLLAAERAHVVITDPQALDNARIDLKGVEGTIQFEPDPYKAACGAHAIAVMTEWDAYRRLDYARLISDMVRPAFIFDGRNILDHQRLYETGFNVFALGKRPLKHV
jgi:UDPglucose 6-dehydrogenase